MVDRYFLSALEHVIHYLCRFIFPGLTALLRMAYSSMLCFMILALCLAASISAQNLAALLMPISDGVWLILLKSWAQCIVAFRILFRRKPKLILPAETVLSDKPLDRFTISTPPWRKDVIITLKPICCDDGSLCWLAEDGLFQDLVDIKRFWNIHHLHYLYFFSLFYPGLISDKLKLYYYLIYFTILSYRFS